MKDPWIDWLHAVAGESHQISKTVAVGGGCINEARKALGKHPLFIKRNDAPEAHDMFSTEVRGLKLLKQHAQTLFVPQVIFQGKDFEGFDCLVLEWVEAGHADKHFWENFGRGLAALHQVSNHSFGLDHDNFIGKLPQSNTFSSEWPAFYLHQRILPQISMGVASGIFEREVLSRADQLEHVFRGFPTEPPALLHGDLWSGNFIPHPSGTAAIIDPAVHYGNRETEVAFTMLFGGFEDAFYDAYNAYFPLQPGFRERMPLHHLYPLLVHANLFGGGYVRRCMEIMNHYV